MPRLQGRAIFHLAWVMVLAAALAGSGCGGGGGSSASSDGTTTSASSTDTALYAPPAQAALSVSDVQQILSQAIGEAQARNLAATIAVTDRVGNVLAVYRMTGATTTDSIAPAPSGANLDLEGRTVPSTLAAIAKAITGAYLSSAGNAFSTRTAGEIIQQHFPPSPGGAGMESGPLFGVQFSQLPCSDLSGRYGAESNGLIGPKRSPLGLSADPGGLPLYKNGVEVGGIGVEVDGVYGFSDNVDDTTTSSEEMIAEAGSANFTAPANIQANQISLDGVTLAYVNPGTLASTPASAPDFNSLGASVGMLLAVTGYSTSAIVGGAPYGAEPSGVRAARSSEYANPDIFVLTNGSGVNRYPVIQGQDGLAVSTPLTTTEVSALLNQAFAVMSQARAAIREPLNSRAQVTITVTDTYGTILGLVLAPDATLFGVDVSVQKARSAAFFSNAVAASNLQNSGYDPAISNALSASDLRVEAIVSQVRSFLGLPTALTGATAFAERSLGDLSRPFFPDGQDGTANGPLSYPISSWNPFATGLQSALITDNLLHHVEFVSGAAASDTAQFCTNLPAASQSVVKNRLANGLQIFPGGVPLYRGSTLVGAIGVSGDGVDQDDMIAFLGASQASTQVGTIANAPAAIRADQIIVPNTGGTRLRYVSCPVSPFLNSTSQNVCQGL